MVALIRVAGIAVFVQRVDDLAAGLSESQGKAAGPAEEVYYSKPPGSGHIRTISEPGSGRRVFWRLSFHGHGDKRLAVIEIDDRGLAGSQRMSDSSWNFERSSRR